MKLPKKLKIGAVEYSVFSDHNMAAEDNKYGECNFRRLVIRIDSGAHDDRQRQTLMHEALEAADEHYHIKLTHDQIEQLEAAISALLLDNPGVFT
ncbi:MAG: hypothetical protein WC322_05700 [Candidatus Paceibacterota bacterium]|jgi:hypothetical protein